MSLGDSISRKILPLYQKAQASLHELKYVFFEITHRCNLSCLHCGSDCVKDTETPDLPTEAILRVLGEIKSRYDSRKITVALSGGEPLCYPGVFDLGSEITALEYPWGMVTNGFGWTGETVKAACAAGMQSVSISLDGFSEDHNWLRGSKHSFNRAVRTIRTLTAGPYFQEMDVITCVNRKNLHTLDEFYEFIRDLGVERWRIFTISPISRAVNFPDLFLESDQFRLLLDKIISYKNRQEIDVNYTESGYLGSRYEKQVRNVNYFCQAGINVAGIMVNGDILACPNIDRRFAQGNIYKDFFPEIWEKKFQIFRNRSWMKTGRCVDCKEWKVCRGNSFHLWDIDRNRTKLCHFELLNG